MINNRPKQLDTLKYYKRVPNEFLLTPNQYPKLLANDVNFLHKTVQPWTKSIEDIHERHLRHKNELIEFYINKRITFQMIFIVASVYDFKEVSGILTAVPYALSIVPSSPNDITEPISPESAVSFYESELLNKNSFFTNFDPFTGNYGIWSSEFYGSAEDRFTDELGLIIGAYFLASDYEQTGVILPSPYNRNEFTQRKFLKHRENKYFESFSNTKPRKIWGADSPIELFLLQALSKYKEYPEIQTIIYEDGSIYPNYYEMVYESEWKKGRLDISIVDFYFPKEKIAVFTDSKFHRGKKRKLKDDKIDEDLAKLSIEVIRFNPKEIILEVDQCAQKVIHLLNLKRQKF